MTTEDTILKMAQDIGYVRGVIEPLAEANLVARMTAVEKEASAARIETKELREKGQKRLAIALAVVASLGAVSQVIITSLVFLLGGNAT